MSEQTIQQGAQFAYDCFETFTRDDPDETLYRLKDDRPEWVQELVYAAHDNGDWFPDDHRYDLIHSALSAISDADDEDLDDLAYTFADNEVDAYTARRFTWLASNLKRQGYVDEAQEEFGASASDIATAVGLGQYFEAREVFGQVLDYLRGQGYA